MSHKKANSKPSTSQGKLSFSAYLLTKAKGAIIILQLKRSPLMLLGQWCANDCNMCLNKHTMKLFKENKITLEGIFNKKMGMWDIPTKSTIQNKNFIMTTVHSNTCMEKIQTRIFVKKRIHYHLFICQCIKSLNAINLRKL